MDLNTLLNTLVSTLKQDALTSATSQIGAASRTGTTSAAGATSQAIPNLFARPRIDPTMTPAGSGSADIYHGSQAPTSASLLAQSGVSAYTRLQNALATGEMAGRSAAVLRDDLIHTSGTLKSAYQDAVARLPAPLQGKDWGFTVADGELVFLAGEDELSAQDLTDLQKAFSGAEVKPAAARIADVFTSIDQMRRSGAAAGSLAWGRPNIDESNFSGNVDLRVYVTATVPGGKYNPAPPGRSGDPGIPATLGGMYLMDLVTARPDFLQADGSVTADALHADDAPETLEETGTLHGQCLCGEVRFAVEDTFEYAFYCHCSRCRQRTGSVFAAIAGIGVDKVRITAGREHLLIEGECADGYGARCGRCHSFLLAAVRERQYVNINLGCLGGTPSRLPDHHIHVASKAPWYRITDGLRQYEELP